MTCTGILLINKPKGATSFRLVAAVRALLRVAKVGHAGTLDPAATGLLVLLVGREYTQRAAQYLNDDKGYEATITLGSATDSYDSDGVTVAESEGPLPSRAAVEAALESFQGWQEQVPPMFSAKQVNGKRLYELARQGVVMERKAQRVFMAIELVNYEPPYLSVKIACSKGTYIRSFADDIGRVLGCYGHLSSLCRCKSGQFLLKDSLDGKGILDRILLPSEVSSHLIKR